LINKLNHSWHSGSQTLVIVLKQVSLCGEKYPLDTGGPVGLLEQGQRVKFLYNYSEVAGEING
jgi:hypothetical protein